MELVEEPEGRLRKTILGQYYTSARVSEVLVAAMSAYDCASIIDLGTGRGQLAQAALAKWAPSSLITVELDAGSVPAVDHECHSHIQADALDVGLPDRLRKIYGEFDIAVCNPPYIRPAWRPDFSQILEDAGLANVCPVFQDVRAEILFLAQNLRMTKSGGQIGLVVPDGPITGERCRELRRHLLTDHRIECVIGLPRGVFAGTEARAHILVLRKAGARQSKVCLMSLGEDGVLSAPLSIDAEAAVHRLDHQFHAARTSSIDCRRVTLREIGATIVRGSLSSMDMRRAHVPVFHTSDFPDLDERVGISLPGRQGSSAGVHSVAHRGDILIARVDRALENKVCRVATGFSAFSDCVFRVRVPSPWSQKVFDALASSRGAHWLNASARGVGARYITRDALFDFGI